MALPSWILYVSVVTLSLLSGRATAQEDVCACSPSKYTFTLDFSLACPPVNVTRNPGIAATFCQISPFGDANQTIEDLVPVEIESVDVLELGQEFEVLSQQNITGPYVNGDSFDYTSIITREDFNGVPKVIQLNIFALNQLGERIVNFFAISYSNICDEFPTLIEGGSSGWTHFTKLESPSTAQCPGVSTPVLTDPPSVDPSDPPSGEPTDSPVEPTVPTVEPTDSPVEPTVPTVEPTDSPVEPTVPTVEPTDSPVVPTDPPTSMSMSMNLSTDLEDVLIQVMSMSMDMAAESGAFFRFSETKSAKYEKSDKSAKLEKSDKKDKASKDDKKEKRRRLRVRPIYQAV